MNILIKLTCLVGLVIAPLLGSHQVSHVAETNNEIRKEIRVQVSADGTDLVEATIETTTIQNGEKTTEEKTISGTEQEVQAALDRMKEVEVAINTTKE